jgi:hypothetical protein
VLPFPNDTLDIAIVHGFLQLTLGRAPLPEPDDPLDDENDVGIESATRNSEATTVKTIAAVTEILRLSNFRSSAWMIFRVNTEYCYYHDSS